MDSSTMKLLPYKHPCLSHGHIVDQELQVVICWECQHILPKTIAKKYLTVPVTE